MKNKKFLSKNILCFLTILITLFFFIFIYKYSFRMLFWDQWSIVKPVAVEKIDFNMWQYQHNEHRIGTGLIITKILAITTGWNNLTETFFQGLMFLIVVIISFNFLNNFSSKNKNITDLSIPLIILNLNQWGNLTWGFQISFILPVLFLFINLFLLEKRKNYIYDLLVLLISILSSRSSFHGTFVSLISALFYFLLIIKNRKIEFKYILLSLLNFLIFVSYFIGLNFSNQNNNIDFLSIIKYGLSLINNFSGYHRINWFELIIPGFILYILGGYFLKFKIKSKFPIIGMTIFSVLFIIVTSFGRSNFGVEQAFSSRYNTPIFPLFLATYYVIRENKSKINKLLFFGLIIIFFFQGIFLAKHELNIYAFKKGTDNWKTCYLKNHDAYFCEKETNFKIYPNLNDGKIIEKLSILKTKKMNLY